MMLPNHIIDLVCSLEEQAVSDSDIIRWCVSLMNNPKEASKATLFLEKADRVPEEIDRIFESGL